MYPKLDVAPLWGYSLLAISFYILLILKLWNSSVKAPSVGVRSRLEAGMISNFRFYKNAQEILLDGYTRVRLMLDCKARTDVSLVQRSNIQIHESRYRHACTSSQVRE